ncbi:RNA polymerase subunit sigma-24, partial [Burkholderia multivorans]
GVDFSDAEDAVQEALIAAVRTWPGSPPRDPQAWLVTVAWRRHVDRVRTEAARTEREAAVVREAAVRESGGHAAASTRDETLDLYVLCAHPDLSPSSAVALTLRAVGGLTTKQIAEAFLVPEATMAQRISRAKRTIAGSRLN